LAIKNFVAAFNGIARFHIRLSEDANDRSDSLKEERE
jgi:hypothetical protein